MKIKTTTLHEALTAAQAMRDRGAVTMTERRA